jgi:hypothetical protein
MLSDSTFTRLMEFSAMSAAEREAAMDKAQPQEIQAYLNALESLGRLDVPAPSAARKWAGRAQLIDAAASYQVASAPRVTFPWVRPLQSAGLALGLGVLVLASFGAGITAAGVQGSGGTFSEVLSALGLRQSKEPQSPNFIPLLPVEVPAFNPGVDLSAPAPLQSIGEDEGFLTNEESESPAGDPQNTELPIALPPGQGGENPGQGHEPPGQGGENPGQGHEPPGQGGENPGQGHEPPGQGGENPGQGVEPPGQGGENPGLGQGNENQGPGANNGQGNENPGQGHGNKE